MKAGEIYLHHHKHLAAGVAALAWAILAVDAGSGPIVPQLPALCSAEVAGGFAFVALSQWMAHRAGKRAGA